MKPLTYTTCGDYEIPNIVLTNTNRQPIGKYGRMRRQYLQEHRPILYNQMILNETLFSHLAEVDHAAQERKQTMLPQMKAKAGVTEELKASDPMKWVGLMYALDAQMEEIICSELIYV